MCFQVDITRDGCGSSKLCVENATNCDPTMDNMCFFVSAEVNQTMPPNGNEFTFEVAGYSPSAIAMGLTAGNTPVNNPHLHFKVLQLFPKKMLKALC